MTTPCPNPLCHGPRRPGQLLCDRCWVALSAATRAALIRSGPQATARVRQLHAQLADRRPLHEIKVSP